MRAQFVLELCDCMPFSGGHLPVSIQLNLTPMYEFVGFSHGLYVMHFILDNVSSDFILYPSLIFFLSSTLKCANLYFQTPVRCACPYKSDLHQLESSVIISVGTPVRSLFSQSKLPPCLHCCVPGPLLVWRSMLRTTWPRWRSDGEHRPKPQSLRWLPASALSAPKLDTVGVIIKMNEQSHLLFIVTMDFGTAGRNTENGRLSLTCVCWRQNEMFFTQCLTVFSKALNSFSSLLKVVSFT